MPARSDRRTRPAVAEVSVRCPLCRAAVAVTESELGQPVRCPDCDSRFTASLKPTARRAAAALAEDPDADFVLSEPVPTPRYIPSRADEVDADELYDEPQRPPAPPGSAKPHKPGDTSRSPEPPVERPLVGQFGTTCPLCHTRLYVTQQQVGQSITCPDCHTQFTVAPPRKKSRAAAASTDEEDDEWRLSEPPTLPKYEPLTRGEVTRAELDEVERKPSLATPRPPQPAPATTKSRARGFDFEAVCRHCGSRIPVREEQVGQTIQCQDCHSSLTVTRPRPTRRLARPVVTESGETPLPLAPTAAEAARTAPSESALRWIGRAERDEEEKEPPRPSIEGLSYPRQLLGFLGELGTLLRIVGLSVGLAILMFLGTQAMAFSSAGAMAVFVAVIAVFFVCVLVPLTMYWANCSLAIVVETSNGARSVEDWSDDMIVDWLGQAMYIVVALLVSAVPAAVLAGALSVFSESPWISFAALVLSCTFFFPLVLLSMIDASHVLQFYSPDVWAHVRASPRVWLRLYATSALLALALAGAAMGMTSFAAGMPRLAGLVTPFAALLTVTLSFAYFRAIGLAAAESGTGA